MLKKIPHSLRNPIPFALVIAVILLFTCPSPAQAMHIAEGILPAGWAVLWYCFSAVFVITGIIFIRNR